MATATPARLLGLDARKGVLAAGYDADIVILDDGFEVVSTIVAGEVIYSRPD